MPNQQPSFSQIYKGHIVTEFPALSSVDVVLLVAQLDCNASQQHNTIWMNRMNLIFSGGREKIAPLRKPRGAEPAARRYGVTSLFH
jgi:hypothetical protein